MNKVRLLNIDLDNVTFEELLQQFTEGVLVTPNVDHLIKLQKDREFYECYQKAEFTVCDSRILFIMSKLLFPGNSLKAQITGSDFFPAFCDYHSHSTENVKVFLLGGTEETVQQAKDKINQRTNSGIVVAAYSPPFGFEASS